METGIIKKVKTMGITPTLVHDLVFVDKGIMKLTIECLAIADDGRGGFTATGYFAFLKDGKGQVFEAAPHDRLFLDYMGEGVTTATLSVSVVNDRIFIKAIGEEGKRISYKFNICPKYLQL